MVKQIAKDVFIKDLSEELNKDRSVLHKALKRMKIQPAFKRRPDTAGQAASCITEEEADFVRNFFCGESDMPEKITPEYNQSPEEELGPEPDINDLPLGHPFILSKWEKWQLRKARLTHASRTRDIPHPEMQIKSVLQIS